MPTNGLVANAAQAKRSMEKSGPHSRAPVTGWHLHHGAFLRL